MKKSSDYSTFKELFYNVQKHPGWDSNNFVKISFIMLDVLHVLYNILYIFYNILVAKWWQNVWWRCLNRVGDYGWQ